MRNIQIAFILAVAALLSLGLAACGSDDNGDDGPTPTVLTEPMATDVDSDGDVVPSGDGEPVDGDDGDDGSDDDELLPTDEPDDGDEPGAPLQIEVIASNFAFTPDTIQAAADQTLVIAFDNQDSGIPHNFAVFNSEEDAEGGDDPIVATEIASGPNAQVLQVPALDSGTIFVWCQVHMGGMTATLTLR